MQRRRNNRVAWAAGANDPSGFFIVTPREIASLQQELLRMPRQEILDFYFSLETDDPRFEVVDAMVKAYRLHLEVA